MPTVDGMSICRMTHKTSGCFCSHTAQAEIVEIAVEWHSGQDHGGGEERMTRKRTIPAHEFIMAVRAHVCSVTIVLRFDTHRERESERERGIDSRMYEFTHLH